MKKRLLLAIAIIFTTILSYGQEWFPVGAQWTYSIAYPGTPEVGVAYMECTKDTLIEGITAKVLVSEDICSSNYSENIFYYNPDTDILYYYVENAFRPYYDFSKNAGESYYTYFPTFDNSLEASYDSLLLTVDSVVIKSFAGIDIRYQYITHQGSDYQLSNFIMEYIGGIFPYPIYGACDFDQLTELRCYHDQIFSYYAKTIYEEQGCDIQLFVKESNIQNVINVFPNPIFDYITISTTHNAAFITYELFDLQGKILDKGGIFVEDRTINVSNLQRGIYFIRFMDEKRNVLIKKLIKK